MKEKVYRVQAVLTSTKLGEIYSVLAEDWVEAIKLALSAAICYEKEEVKYVRVVNPD